MVNEALLILGAGLVVTGFAPTPDDVTIVSPLVQIIGGTGLVIASFFVKDGKR